MIDSVSSASFSAINSFRQKSAFDFQNGQGSTGKGDFADLSSSKDRAKKDSSNPNELTDAEKKQVEELKKRDAEVRAHEQAHLAAAGSLAMSGANYVFQTGPDGKPYAIGGDVKIDTSEGRTPEETRRKAQQIRAAALAVDEPSGQDLKVANGAAILEQQAAQNGQEPETGKSSGFPPSPEEATTPSSEITSSRQIAVAQFANSAAEQEQAVF